MTLEEFTAKLQEFRTMLTDKATDLEENPKWVMTPPTNNWAIKAQQQPMQ